MTKTFCLIIIFNLLISGSLVAKTVVPSEEVPQTSGNSLPDAWDIPSIHHPVLGELIDDVPLLHDQNIQVKSARISTTMNVRPTIWSLFFRQRENRTYIVRVNSNDQFDGVLYETVPHEAKVGLWFHELMHIKDFKNRNFWGVAQRGWQYLSQRGRIKFEREIDDMVLEAGYWYYLYQWTYFVLYESDISDEYKEFKRNIYMTPEEILETMEQMGYIHIPLFYF